MVSRSHHWESRYRDTGDEALSWYQDDPAQSLRLIAACGLDPDAPIVDIGGGSSVLVDHLVDDGFVDVTVVDLSATALARARDRLGARASLVTWIEGDVLEHSFDRRFRLWHDRAAFHFLTEGPDRDAYLERMVAGVVGDGHVVMATFGPEAPPRCSGLPVMRYDAESLSEALGPDLALVEAVYDTHQTPRGVDQQFLFARFRRRTAA